MPTSDAVAERVRSEIEADPSIGSTKLYRRLSEEGLVGDDVTRAQFHGRYVLPALRARKRASGENGTAPKAAGATGTRRRGGKAKKATARAPRGTPSGSSDSPAARSAPATADAERIRGILLRFAQELSNARSRGELVGILAGVDGYVAEVIGEKKPPKREKK